MNKFLTLIAITVLICCKAPETKEPIFTGDLSTKKSNYSNVKNPNALRLSIELNSSGELNIRKADLARGRINRVLDTAEILEANQKNKSLGFRYELEYQDGSVMAGHFFVPTTSYTSYYAENDSFVTHDEVTNNRWNHSFLIPLEAAKNIKSITTNGLSIKGDQISLSERENIIDMASILKSLEGRNVEVLRKTSYFNDKNTQSQNKNKP